jgi:Rrf2 family protein
MKLSHSIVYALQAIIALAEADSDTPVPSRQLADRGKMPDRFLLQVLRTLVANGVLRSSFGVSGGYYLARPPHEITVLHILDAFESPLTTPSTPALPGFTAVEKKQLLACLAESVNAARHTLAGFTIADLISLRADNKDKLLSAAS